LLTFCQIKEENETSTSPFEYSELKDGYIRVFELLPGSKDNDIAVTLSDYQLKDAPPFECLSYCWGDTEDTTSIQVNGHSIMITKNLRAALAQLRHETGSRTVWVDAICINQLDLAERARQVTLMADIYKSAIRTTVWLGPDLDGEGRKAIRICYQLAKDAASAGKVDWLTDLKRNPDNEVIKKENVLNDQYIFAVDDLVNKPWWSRVWVVQEFALSRNVVLCCGKEEIDWTTFSQAIDFGLEQEVWYSYHVGIFKDTTFDLYRSLTTIEKHINPETPANSLTELLIALRYRNATEPKDKIFAVLGLLGVGKDEVGTKPDYQSTTEQVYTGTTKAILKLSGNLNILGVCSTHDLKNHKITLPSWVPDWIPQDIIPPPFSSPSSMYGKIYNASKDTTCSPRFEDDHLILSGHIFETIDTIACILPECNENQWNDLDDAAQMAEVDAMSNIDKEMPFLEKCRRFYALIGLSCKLIAFYAKETYDRFTLIVPHLAAYIEWEKYANIVDPECEQIYMKTLCAGRTTDDHITGEPQYREWLKSLSPVRTLIRRNWKSWPRSFRMLAFLGYFRATWDTYPEFTKTIAHLQNRRLARTKQGHLCVIPATAGPGDEVWLFHGGKVPLVLRRDDTGGYKLVGEAYIQGIMYGEAFRADSSIDVSIR
jgi:hypothetical protein